MSLLREFFEGKGKPLQFVEPKPAPVTYEQKAARLAAAEMENAVLGATGGSIRPRRTPSAIELQRADEEKAARDAADAEATASRSALAELQERVARAERAAVAKATDEERSGAQLAADVKARLDNAKKVRREQKRAKKGRK